MTSSNIDMTFPKMPYDNDDICLRYCASQLSIPHNAFNVSPIWRSLYSYQDIINKQTGLSYGFSYNIMNCDDKCFNKRKIEDDISFDRNFGNNFTGEYFEQFDQTDSYNEFINSIIDYDVEKNHPINSFNKYSLNSFNKYSSYDNFVNYYNDETFIIIDHFDHINHINHIDHVDDDKSNNSYDSYKSYKSYESLDTEFINSEQVINICEEEYDD